MDGADDGATVGVDDGIDVGIGLGIMVGEQAGGLPSGPSLNIGCSGLHSTGQHKGQPSGKGITLQSSRLTVGSIQSRGLDSSSNGRKHESRGH